MAKASVSCDKGSGIKPRRQQSFSSCFPKLFILNYHFHCKHYLLGNCKLCTLVLGRPETTSTRIAKIQCLAQLASSHFNLNFQIPSHFLNFCHRDRNEIPKAETPLCMLSEKGESPCSHRIAKGLELGRLIAIREYKSRSKIF